MLEFKELKIGNDNIKSIIKTAFDVDLDISGSWGYTQEEATVIHSDTIPIKQLEHMFASMRAYTEMNLTQKKESRYGSINTNEISREEFSENKIFYHHIIYEITAIKEDLYNDFIKEYKENYGKKDFDLNAHFQKREEATLRRRVIHWFKTDINNLFSA
jgi:hypothetical protein